MLNEYQQQLFVQLEQLVAANEAFYRQEFVLDNVRYWIYNYRLASYTDFLAPGALEARGIMYEVDDQGRATRLASMPMRKFFNRNENPFTMNVDLSEIEAIEVKSDGSLISTYWHESDTGLHLRLKTKGSLFSEQAIAAMEWLARHPNYQSWLEKLTVCYDYTVNLEWVGPENRIVLGYMEPRLILLNIRNNKTGEYLDLSNTFQHIQDKMAGSVDLKGMTPAEFVEAIPDMTDEIEGFVIKMKTGLWMKVKTNKYVSLHHAKDAINNPRRLFEAVVDEGVDDIRSIFYDDILLMKQIDEMQQKVDHIFNHMVNLVETFYNQNKHLDRKDYAIKGQQEIDSLYFGLVMSKYLGKSTDYKNFLKSKYKAFGIKDDITTEI